MNVPLYGGLRDRRKKGRERENSSTPATQAIYMASTFIFEKYGKQLIESPCHLKLPRKIYY